MSTQLCPPAASVRAAGPPHALAGDELLAARAREGDLSAFDLIVERHRPAMLARTRRVVGPDAAEDAVQLALVNAWRALRSGCEVDNVRGWLLTIAHRCALQWLRDRRETSVVLSELLPGGVTPVEALEESMRTREVLRAVSRLPDDERRAFVATAIHGRSGRATADALGVSEGMVRQLVFRARARVREAARLGLPAALLPRLLAPLHARARGTSRWVQAGTDGAGAQAGRLGGRIALVLAAGALAGGAPAVIHGLEGLGGSAAAQHAAVARPAKSRPLPAPLGRSGARRAGAEGALASGGALRGGSRTGETPSGSPASGEGAAAPAAGGAPYPAGSHVDGRVSGADPARAGAPRGGMPTLGETSAGPGGAAEQVGGSVSAGTAPTVEKAGQLAGHGTEAVGETVKGVGEAVKGVGQTVTGTGEALKGGAAGETVAKAGETVGKVGETVAGAGETVKGLGEKVGGGATGSSGKGPVGGLLGG